MRVNAMPHGYNLYDVLNVSAGAEPEVIDAAYKALMKKYHPDQGVSTGIGRRSAADINKAYAILRDPAKRGEYDRRETALQEPLYFGPPPVIPQARMSAAAWSGWLVALLLAVAVATLVGGGAGQPLRATRAPPTIAEADEPTPGKKIAAESARPVLAERPVLPVVIPAASEEMSAEDPVLPRLVHAPPGVKSRPPAAKAAARAEEDFLEREGYIY
jgi:hypothetical protein